MSTFILTIFKMLTSPVLNTVKTNIIIGVGGLGVFLFFVRRASFCCQRPLSPALAQNLILKGSLHVASRVRLVAGLSVSTCRAGRSGKPLKRLPATCCPMAPYRHLLRASFRKCTK